MRQLEYSHVLLTLWNRLFTPLIFPGKLMALTCSILGTFYVMKHIGSGSTLLLLFFGSLSLEALAFYVFSIQKPGRIPIICDRIKGCCFRLLCHRSIPRRELSFRCQEKLLVVKLRTMPDLVVREMGYRRIEGLSTIVFIDFYLTKVISLILTF